MTNPGVSEGTVQAIAEGFRGSPSCFAAVLLAAMISLLTYFSSRDQQGRDHDRAESQRQLMIEILENCPLPDDRAKAERPPQ